MNRELTLDETELDLIVELLKRERRDLPAEIHHTDTTEFRERLLRRQETVGKLLAALQER